MTRAGKSCARSSRRPPLLSSARTQISRARGTRPRTSGILRQPSHSSTTSLITVVGSDVVEEWEGCLSIPDVRGRVPRAREIWVRALDRSGGRLELRAHDFPARVIQHETDHLDGVLFFDRMRSLETLTFLDEYSRYWAKD